METFSATQLGLIKKIMEDKAFHAALRAQAARADGQMDALAVWEDAVREYNAVADVAANIEKKA